MNVGKAIYNILSNDSAIATSVTKNGVVQIFPNAYKAPTDQGSPYILYHEITNTPNNTKNGISTYDYVRVQITCFDTRYGDLVTLTELVRRALDYTSGTFDGVVVDKCFYEGSVDLFDESFGNNGIYYRAMDFRFNVNV